MPVNDQRIRKSNLGYLPSDKETLEGYVLRLKDIIDSIRYGSENVLHQEKFWCHINPRSSSCFVCDILDMMDYLQSLMGDLVKNDKKNRWFCERPPNTHDNLSFEFKPRNKPRS